MAWPSHGRELFDPQTDRELSGQLTLLVFMAQCIGLVLIWAAVNLLDTLPPDSARIANWLVVIGFAFLLVIPYCWRDFLLNLYERTVTRDSTAQRMDPIPEFERKIFLLHTTFIFVLADSFLLLALIALTGGFGHSPLDPLLPVIPVIAIILRQPSRTVYVSIAIQILFILSLVVYWLADELGVGQWLWHSHVLGFDSHGDPKFMLAFAVVAIGSIGLSLFEYYLSHGRPPLAMGLGPIIRETLRNQNVMNKKGVQADIQKGLRDWIAWLEDRGLPPTDVSLVHDAGNVASQAVILSLPFWDGEATEKEKRSVPRRITFMTYCAHWIDDHFDPISVRSADTEFLRRVQECGPQELLTSDPCIQQLLFKMKRFAIRGQSHQIERAVTRIVYGGLIQNAASAERCNRLLRDYVEYVSDGISECLRETYRALLTSKPLSIWTTTKVVLELLDCCGKSFSIERAEFCNLLYAPVLYYQDIDSEIEKERFGRAFGATPEEVKEQLPTEEDMLSLIETCAQLQTHIFTTEGFPSTRKAQLACLRATYKSQLPTRVFDAYDQFLAY